MTRNPVFQGLGIMFALCAGVAMSGGGEEILKESTYQELMAYGKDERMVAVVRCAAATVRGKGLRSERVELQTTMVFAVGSFAAGQTLVLTRYTQSDPVMEVGRTYLVAAYRGEWLPAWSLVEARPIASGEAEQAVRAASAKLAAP